MRLYNNVCITCSNNRVAMPSQGVQVTNCSKHQTVPKEKSQRPSRGIITVSSWQENQDHQMRKHHTRSWPSSYEVHTIECIETSAGGSSPCEGPKRRAQSVSPEFAGNFKGASAVPSKPLIHHQRHSLKNKFQVLNTLGEGSYGKVKLAIDKGTGEHVAIKYIKKTKIQDETDQARIRREIQILSSLRHQHIVNVREVYEKKDRIVLVMDYAPGGELYDYLNKMGRLTEQEARRIFRQIVSAVHHCHENGVVHRDLKLENIILDNEGNVKIADFGLSNYFRPASTLSTFCGSPLYASPEIVNGQPYHGPEVDVWSLGVILYTLVYGAMPFESSNVAILRQQISHGLYSEPIIASEAAGLIHHMLTVAPSRRATMEDILHHWWVNFNYSNMPNNMPYKPDPELPDTKPGSATDRNSTTTELPALGDSQNVHFSADSDTEMNVGQDMCSVSKTSNNKKDITTSSSEAVSHITDGHKHQQSRGNIAAPASIPSALSKLPQDVLEILLKGCSKKTLNALFGSGQVSPGFDTKTSHDVYNEAPKTGEEESRSENPDFVQKSHAVSQFEKRPARGILKRKGKFSGGDSGCVINEDMSRHDESSVHAPDYLHQKPLPMEANDVFVLDECKSHLTSNNECCGLNDNSCTAICRSAFNASSYPTDSQHVHDHHCYSRILQNAQDNRSSHDIFNKAISRATSSLQEEFTQTSAHEKAKLNFTCDCKSTVDSTKTFTLPKSILKNCKKPSLEDGMKRLSISSYGSNSSVDLFDLSYDSADSGHFVHPRLHFSPTGKINIDDSGYDDQPSVESDQLWRHVDDSKLVVPIIAPRNSCEPGQRSKSHSI